MGALIVEQIVSADGFAADPAGGLDWVEEWPESPDIDTEQLRMLDHVDAIVLGANTYRMFAAYWPEVTPEVELVAGPINTLPKHVVSNSLERAPWGDGEIAIERGDGVASVERILQHYPRDVIVWGSLELSRALFTAGIVDVLRLRIVPVLLGSGLRHLPGGLPVTRLDVRSSHVHAGGQVSLEYAVRKP